MFVASESQGIVQLDQEFGDPMYCPSTVEGALEPMEIESRSKHAHKRYHRAVQRRDHRHP
jgi:N-formylglutamate amidohydrolase